MDKESKSLAIAKQFLGKEVEVIIDRPMGSKHPTHGFTYEANYGYIENTAAPDGENLDAYFLGISTPAEKARGRAIAIIHRLEDDDDKLIVVPQETEMTDKEIESAVQFQEQWFTHTIIRNS